ncbi:MULTISPECIES: SEC-C metal-binding domain-containing protein [unclassified Halanaerobium]|uniref:SEC-C metal-binding domain-containing protein n=1 Tax=unclassified Halanaerobium TaxID=2641197 RepID=UPI000DF3B918|nr:MULTISPECIES: SEC-C metal-binding domain-containing protein [unclassified Halanaerobium]RCW49830.1 SEC-C motif-containing protein [Halanaerobium sp. MA284_MarDTE_T2]RCW88474.1 SEC-C motif-containing protein [Halanaerobium sp. DL-01]
MNTLTSVKNMIKNRREDNTVKNYDIGRNESCPCGSGKKYKKCCLNNTPELSKDEYYQAVKETDDEKDMIVLLQNAVKDYPEEPAFLLPLIVYNLQKGIYRDAAKYLKHGWQLMKTDLDEAFIPPFVSILLDEDKIDKAEDIVRHLLEKKGESVSLLISYAEVYKYKDDYIRVSEIIDRAVKLEPENIQLLIFRLETLMDLDDILSALSLWEKHYEKLQSLNNMRVVSFLNDFLEDKFNLKENANLTKKEALNKAVAVFSGFGKIDNLRLEKDKKKAGDILLKLKNIIPDDSPIVIDILARMLAAELYVEFEKYINEIENANKENPNFYRMLYLYNYKQGKINDAGNNIRKAFELAADQESGHFHLWQIASDYLKYLIDYENSNALFEFLRKFNNYIGENESFLVAVLMLLEDGGKGEYQEKFLIKLLKSQKIEGVDSLNTKDIYSSLLFLKLSVLEREEISLGKAENKTITEIKNIISKLEKDKMDTPAKNYARLRLLKYQDKLEEEEEERLINNLKEAEVKSYFDTIAYYEAVLRFGDPGSILTDIPYGEYLNDDYLNFYRLVAAFKLSYYEMGASLFYKQISAEIKNQQLGNYLARFLRYFSSEELLKHLKNIEADQKIINFLKQMTGKM